MLDVSRFGSVLVLLVIGCHCIERHLLFLFSFVDSLDSSFSRPIVTGYGLDIRDSIACTGKNFFLRHHVQTSSGHTQRLSQCVSGALSRGRVVEPITDYPPPSSAKVKNKWNYTSTSPYLFMASGLIKHIYHEVGQILVLACRGVGV
jgi:hypothetical protein